MYDNVLLSNISDMHTKTHEGLVNSWENDGVSA